ncbi:adenylate/guanylate cyclase domain-containing protein [Bradyrhizobium uaiense]|uniref:HAMP domain-containing protein n=1 Tax=Bradyrhizobium uaiense TaxID=2594946 RepID=A0A6P1BRR8_9BRAD|nr:adenylate/guanylate cyclase domain-containing protein [Bradyrhizobium uaiense]NEV01204.1 HAMP domain-containing protein [Bradyrhizobium uaiense]NEV01207.1 HAMP domain-containing protein [Bradyrhizobium uaiense]
MTIRKKFFLLAGILLALFGAVVGALAYTQKLDRDQLANIYQYELPLSNLIAEFDVDTDRYELRILRVLRSDFTPDEHKAAAAEIKALADEMRSTVTTSDALVAKAIRDTSYDADDRIELARIGGVLKYLERSLEEFITVGETTLAAAEAGKREEARQTSLGFARFAQAFGPDLSQIRHDLSDLTSRSTNTVLGRQRLNAYLSFALFVAACALGLGISAVGSTRVVAGLRQLVASTRAVEVGGDVQPVSIRTRDEVGELAQAFNRMLEELRERDRLKDTFGKFLDPRLVSRLIASGADQAERRNLSIFFSDIKHFTGISEQLTAGTIVNLLNEYFGTIANVIHANRGIIDKYIGDAVMAFWVAPFSAGDDHARDACCAALAQQQAVSVLRSRLPEITGMRRNAPELVIRMGIATGDAVVGTIGSEAARSYTVIGDSVNLASRLEGLNKVYGTLILISEETYRLAQADIEARELDFITVAGKTEPVRIYELMAPAGQLEPAQSELREKFATVLVAYRKQDWDGALAAIEECLQIAPDDGPAQAFLQRIGLLRSDPPGPAWDGIWHHLKK